MSDVLDYLNYNQMMDDTSEFLTDDKWDVTFDKMPAAVYWPGDTFVKFRLKSVDGISTSIWSHAPLSTKIRGFETPVQAGRIEMVNTTITLHLADYEDQSIYVFLTDWMFKCCDPVTQKGYKSKDLRANMTFTRLNALNQPVRRYVMKAGIIETPNYEDPFNSDGRNLLSEDSTIPIKGMLFPPEFLTLGV